MSISLEVNETVIMIYMAVKGDRHDYGNISAL